MAVSSPDREVRDDRPDKLPPDAVVTGVASDGFRCKWCGNSGDLWVKQSPPEGGTYLRTWCAECFNETCPPFGDDQPTMSERQLRGKNAAENGRVLNRWIETETSPTDTGGIAGVGLYKQYEAFCADEDAETVAEAAWLGRLASMRQIELEGESDESDDALGGLYLRGVVPE